MKINNVLIIDGAGRKDGYTKKLIEIFKENAEYENVVCFETYKESFAFCDGCNYCEEQEKCKHRDLDTFFTAFENVDLIVFATPIYNGGFSAPLKALIDRFQLYYTYFYKHNKKQKITKRRKAILLASSGRDGEEAVAFVERQLKFAFSILNIELTGTALCNYTDTSARLNEAENKIKSILKGDGFN